jgi:Ca2+-binding RTX toxin-like protein
MPVRFLGSAFRYSSPVQDEQFGEISAGNLGDLVGVWSDSRSVFLIDNVETRLRGVYFRVFDELNPEFGRTTRIATTFDQSTTFQQAVVLNNGNIVASFLDVGRTSYSFTLISQSGDIVRELTLINPPTVSRFSLEYLNLINKSGGGFMTAWSQTSSAGFGANNVFVQLFNSLGNEVGTQIRVNQVGADVRNVEITELHGDRNLAVWESNGGDINNPSIPTVIARIFTNSGTMVTREFIVSRDSTERHDQVTTCALENGGFVVSWRNTDPSFTSEDASIAFQVFDEQGRRVGAEAVVGDGLAANRSGADIVALEDGRFMIVWQERVAIGTSGFGAPVVGQIFNADGSADGDDFLIANVNYSGGSNPSVTSLADGRVIVEWYVPDITGSVDKVARVLDPREIGVELLGTDGDDSYYGTVFADSLKGNAGHDRLLGAAGSDYLVGGAGNDRLIGNAGNDDLRGLTGNDTLKGGDGNDQLRGGTGADMFIFDRTDGLDRIVDFDATMDRVDVTASNFASFVAVRAAMTQTAAGVSLDVGTGSVLFAGLTKSSFSSDDFLI